MASRIPAAKRQRRPPPSAVVVSRSDEDEDDRGPAQFALSQKRSAAARRAREAEKRDELRGPSAAMLFGGGGSKEREIPISQAEMLAMLYFARMSPVVATAIDVIVSNVTAGGLNLVLTVGGKVVELREAFREFFKREWQNGFVGPLVLHGLATGVAVIEFVEAPSARGEFVPSVASPEKYRMTQISRLGHKREYRVYSNAFGAPSAMFGTSGKPFGDPLRNVVVFEMFEPLESGHLASPVAIAREWVANYEHMYANFHRADYWGSRPPWIVATQQAVDVARDVVQNNYSAEDDLGLAVSRKADRVEDDRRRRFELSAGVAQHTSLRIAQTGSLIPDAPIHLGPNPHSKFPPYMHYLEMPLNQTVVAPPPVQRLEQLVDISTHLETKIFRIFGIPEVFVTQRNAYQHTSDMNLRGFQQKIRSYQELLEPLLKRLYLMIYQESDAEFVNNIAQTRAGLKKPKRDGFAFGGAADRRRRASDDGGAPAIDEGSDLEVLDREAGQTSDGEDDEAMDEMIAERVDDALHETLAEQLEIDASIGAKITFNRVLMSVDPLQLQNARDRNFIDDDTLGRHLLTQLGISIEEMLDQKERDAQRKQTIDQQRQELEMQGQVAAKYGAKPAAPGGAKKPAAKKSAAKKKAAPQQASKPAAPSGGGGGSSSSSGATKKKPAAAVAKPKAKKT